MGLCINCQSDQHQKWISLTDIFGDTHHIHRCANCEIYFLDPQPSKEQLDRAYDESYYGLGEKKFNPTVERIIDFFRQQNAKKFAKKIPPRSRVLDIGCGNGNFLANLGKQGNFELHGIEPEGKSADRATLQKEVILHRGVLMPEMFPDQSVDAIILTHVFEHLPNPRQTLQMINKMAKDGAVLQIEIPNIESWQAQFFKSNWLHLDPPRHLHFYPPSVLERELNQLGWELLEEKYFSPQFNPFGAQQSILNAILKKREVLYEKLKGNISYTKEYSSMNLFMQQLFHWLSFPLFVFTDIWASLFKKGATLKIKFRKRI